MNIEEAIEGIKQLKELLTNLVLIKGEINILYPENFVNAIETLLTAYEKEKEDKKLIDKNRKEIFEKYEKEKEKNKIYSDVICRVRNLSSGVVSYDIIDGKKYLGPRKNFSKQRLYEQFLNIELILKGNYIFLSNEEYLQQLIKEE